MAKLSKEERFQQVFTRLREMAKSYSSGFSMKSDTTEKFSLYTPSVEEEEKLFVSVQTKKNYVSFHLFPMYCFPEIGSGMSELLGKRKQGKSCFNFTKVDEDLFEELEIFVSKGRKRYQEEGFL